jgi:hypothetical protein
VSWCFRKFHLRSTSALSSTDTYNYRAPQAAPKAAIEAFVKNFITTYISHGGIVENKNPVLQHATKAMDVDANINNIYQAACNQGNF